MTLIWKVVVGLASAEAKFVYAFSLCILEKGMEWAISLVLQIE